MLMGVDIAGMKPVEGDVGECPELGFVNIKDLVIDQGYQRKIEQRGRKNIANIAENFDWNKFSPLVVARTDCGKYAIIDGQHRVHAAALRGVFKVPALITDMTPTQQASAFSWINGSVTNLTSLQVYKAALAAFEPWAVQCNAVVSSAGCRMMTSNRSSKMKKPGEIYAIGTIRGFVDLGQSEHLSAVLRGIIGCASSDDVTLYDARSINVLCASAFRLGVTRHEFISEFLDENDLEATADRVRRLLGTPEYRGKTFKSLYSPIVLALMRQFKNGNS